MVLPITEFESKRYRISFQKKLSIQPEVLVDLIWDNFEKANLSKNYIVEVIQCNNKAVAYSYENKYNNKSIIPCKGRTLNEDCYVIEIKFIKSEASFLLRNYPFFILLFLIIIGVVFYNLKARNQKKNRSQKELYWYWKV